MKPFSYVLYILIITIILIPKEKLYFTFESFLSDYHISISNEDLMNRLFYLDVDNGSVVMDNQEVATIEHIRITPLIFMNQLTVSSVSISPSYRSFIPGKIDSLVLTYSLLHPLSVSIEGDGDFGHCEGNADILEQKIKIVFDATSGLRRYPLLTSQLHQEKGGLVYESNF